MNREYDTITKQTPRELNFEIYNQLICSNTDFELSQRNLIMMYSYLFIFIQQNLIDNLIAGLITTDGHITKKKCNISLGLSNQNLMNQLYHLCRNNGIDVSFVKGKAGKGMTCDPYSMSIPFVKEIRFLV